MNHLFKEGNILMDLSGGYNYGFFQVVRTTAKSVVIRKVRHEYVDGSCIRPKVNFFAGEEMRKTVSESGQIRSPHGGFLSIWDGRVRLFGRY